MGRKREGTGSRRGGQRDVTGSSLLAGSEYSLVDGCEGRQAGQEGSDSLSALSNQLAPAPTLPTPLKHPARQHYYSPAAPLPPLRPSPTSNRTSRSTMPPIQYGEKKGVSDKDKGDEDKFCNAMRKLPPVRTVLVDSRRSRWDARQRERNIGQRRARASRRRGRLGERRRRNSMRRTRNRQALGG